MEDGVKWEDKEGNEGADSDVPELTDLLGHLLIEKQVEDDHKGTSFFVFFLVRSRR